MTKMTEEGKEELALALLLWYDFKTNGVSDLNVSISLARFAAHLGVEEQVQKLRPKLPPMKVTPRFAEGG